MKNSKRFFLSALLIIICAALTVTAAALRSGDIVGYVLSTDIRAFFDGSEIEAYNIGGKLGIVAEDLRNYGFTVVWNGIDRELQILRNLRPTVKPFLFEPKNVTNVGARVANVLHTDIVTYLDGNVVESFNINGETIIYFSELAKYGTVFYDDGARLSMISTTGRNFKATTLETLPKEIIHAGGAVDGVVGTNSLEALSESYGKGYRFLELDFVMSSDGVPVCLHDWSPIHSSELGSTPISAEKFLQVKILDKYTSLTIDTLAEWMGEHTDAYIITDVKDDNIGALRAIAKTHPEIMPRLCPQIYQYNEYAPVRALGYSNIIFTLYALPRYEDKVHATNYNLSFAQKNSLLGITMDVEIITYHPFLVVRYNRAGVPLFIHTVNDKEEKQALYDKGISCIYTDFTE